MQIFLFVAPRIISCISDEVDIGVQAPLDLARGGRETDIIFNFVLFTKRYNDCLKIK